MWMFSTIMSTDEEIKKHCYDNLIILYYIDLAVRL